MAALKGLDEVITTVAELKVRVEELEAALDRLLAVADEIDTMDHRANGNGLGTRTIQAKCAEIRAIARRALRGPVPEDENV